MKHLFFTVATLAALIVLITGCQTHSHDHATVEPEPTPFSFTIWSKTVELFVDFAPMIIGQESSLAVHFTDLVSFKPIESGKAIIQLLKNGNSVIEKTADAPNSPGLWVLKLAPSEIHDFDVKIILITNSINDTFLLKDIP
ncbi:MAG: hypothetical protein P1U70_06555, partial [Saprospiraceae bacterium]|nr:hypothetical protein [Saprospiraceae bacterium]